jgi:hypothetical protein
VPLANFKISFLGEHKILHLTHANTDPRSASIRTASLSKVRCRAGPSPNWDGGNCAKSM